MICDGIKEVIFHIAQSLATRYILVAFLTFLITTLGIYFLTPLKHWLVAGIGFILGILSIPFVAWLLATMTTICMRSVIIPAT